jgi:uncharacterized membrane protein YbhN (UPF0104 family)
MFLVVLIFVVRHGNKLWHEVGQHPTRLNWGWLGLAVVTSVVAWLPSAYYWRRLISNLGMSPPWPQLLRAYFCGHLGKYVPGKAVAIVIRAALIRDAGVPAPAAAFTVTVESATYMWAGALLSIVLFPSLAPHLPERIAAEFTDPLRRALLIAVVLGGGIAGLVMLTRGFHRLSELFHGTQPGVSPAIESLSLVWASLTGVALFLAAWWLQGLTLGLTIQAVSAEPVSWTEWPFWTGAAAVALVGGFVAVFTPGGLGVREGLLMELLSRQLGPHEAVLVAILLRGVALAGEILAAGALYYGVAGVERPEASKGATN